MSLIEAPKFEDQRVALYVQLQVLSTTRWRENVIFITNRSHCTTFQPHDIRVYWISWVRLTFRGLPHAIIRYFSLNFFLLRLIAIKSGLRIRLLLGANDLVLWDFVDVGYSEITRRFMDRISTLLVCTFQHRYTLPAFYLPTGDRAPSLTAFVRSYRTSLTTSASRLRSLN